MSDSFDLEAPDHFTAGTVGPLGQRIFYLQARQADTLITLKCEKEQVRALAEYLADLLTRLPAAGEEPPREAALFEPIEAAWPVAALGVGYDQADERIVVVAKELAEEEGSGEAATARFRITRAQAAAFVEQARELMKAGRPTCPMCGGPKDPGGHVCPRGNGHGTR
ncbi:MAG: DUF3090 domain-containing protein [Candidatus Rokubacteria bacterium]|nr:DUF3090 domain-containing protein [Candidatus Rokubacteria bacterium]